MNGRYILDEKGNPIPCEDLMEWARWMEKVDRRVGSDIFTGKSGEEIRISTVFLGLDHSFSYGPPMLYETMIFGGDHNDYQERYFLKEEAIAGHKIAVNMVKEELGIKE